MMRVGTQKGKRSSSSSPVMSSAYRQSPTSALSHPHNRMNTPSPLSQLHTSANTAASHFTSSKTQSNVTSQIFRQSSASPVNDDTAAKTVSSKLQSSTYRQLTSSPVYDTSPKYTGSVDYHKMSSAEKRILSGSPSFGERNRQSPSYLERHRMGSPSFGSSEHVSSKKISERRIYETSSPVMTKQTTDQIDYKYDNKYDQESSFTNKVSSMHISESRSPVFMTERMSPNLNYTSRYESKQESRIYSNTETDGVDTSPLLKVSDSSDRATARRDSWDAISKTRGVFSRRSLESLANVEQQIEDKHENSYRTEEHYNATNKLTSRKGGASSVKVQPVPDGLVGQPVEFESKTLFIVIRKK